MLELTWRITGRMDTRFRHLETNGLWPGDEPVSGQIAVTEQRNRPATEIHNELVPGFVEILLHLEAAKGATESRPHELLDRTGSRKNDCLFLEPSKFRTSCNEAHPSRYPLKLSMFCVSGVVGTASAKARFCMRTASNKLNQNRGSKPRAPFVNGRRNCQVL